MLERAALLALALAALAPWAAAAADCPPDVVLARRKDVAVEAAVTRVPLPLPPAALDAEVELVLRDVRFDAHPGTQFHILLERRGERVERIRVGTLSFYAAPIAGGTTTRSFDVTDELRRVARSAADLEDIHVVLEATTGRGGAGAGAIFDPEVGLTIGAVELRAKAE
ncbi:MAG TPA: hypothetical protein VF100_11525 [Thermoanaerobaculia bacterium]